MADVWTSRWRVHDRSTPPVWDPFLDLIQTTQPVCSKPLGLWFTPTRRDWVQWCKDNAPDWLEGTTLSRIEVDASQILVLPTSRAILRFTEEFGESFPSAKLRYIDWGRVAKLWDGIEIVPYDWGLRLDPRCFWYYSWDVASGCVWRAKSVRSTSKAKVPDQKRR